MYLREAQQNLNTNIGKKDIYANLKLKEPVKKLTKSSSSSIQFDAFDGKLVGENLKQQQPFEHAQHAQIVEEEMIKLEDESSWQLDHVFEEEKATELRKSAGVDNDELIKKAKIQVENLNASFKALIARQASKQKKLTYEDLVRIKEHAKFNQNIKSYVDVCCNSPALVIISFPLFFFLP
jgi:hypothetical protein